MALALQRLHRSNVLCPENPGSAPDPCIAYRGWLRGSRVVGPCLLPARNGARAEGVEGRSRDSSFAQEGLAGRNRTRGSGVPLQLQRLRAGYFPRASFTRAWASTALTPKAAALQRIGILALTHPEIRGALHHPALALVPDLKLRAEEKHAWPLDPASSRCCCLSSFSMHNPSKVAKVHRGTHRTHVHTEATRSSSVRRQGA